MKVLQSIPYMLASQGGPSTCTCDLLQGLHEVGAQVDLLTAACGNPADRNLGAGSPWLKEVAMDYRTPLALSASAQAFLEASDYDIYHANTLWLHPVHATCSYARKVGKPYVLSTHGMLYPTALAVSGWKKKLMGALWYREDVMKATCLHATCMAEMEHNRKYGYKGPIAVIPNAVVFPEGVELKDESLELRDRRGRRQIGFLGRLHPIKKVENVIYALDKVRGEGLEVSEVLCFQIMGKFDDQYEQWLKDEVKRLKLEDCVEFVGFVSGKEKYDRLSKLSALMVPSAQENFGMIVPEALICGTPVYASLGTPWSELNGVPNENENCRPDGALTSNHSPLTSGQCGWWQDNNPETITKVILDIFSKSDDELRAMGANGRKLMEEKYEQHKVSQMMVDLYKWINGEGPKPEFVYE